MSISLTLINKSGKERKVSEVITAFSQAVNSGYTKSEREGYVSHQGESCLSVLFQAEGFESEKQPDTLVQRVGDQGGNLVLIKKRIESE